MCNKKRKTVLLVRSVIAFALAAVMVAAMFLPIFKVGAFNVERSEEYSSGAFTQYATPVGEFGIDIFTFIDIGLNFGLIYDIMEIQALNSNLQYVSNSALELYTEMESTTSEEKKAELKAEVDAYVQKGNEVKAELDRAAGELSEERQRLIAEKLGDKDFCEALVVSYLLVENVSDAFVEKDISHEKAAFATNVSGVAEVLIILIALFMLAFFIISFAIVFVIKLIVFLVKLIAKKCEEKDHNKFGKFPYLGCALTFFTIFILWSVVSSLEISMGLGLIIMLSVAVLNSLSISLCRTIANDKNVVDTILNIAVCLVAVVLIIFLTMNLLKIDMMYDYKTSSTEYSYTYFLKAVESVETESIDALDFILDDLAKINVRNTVIILSVSVIVTIIIVAVVSYFIEQLSKEGGEEKEGKRYVSRSGIALCSLVLVIALIPSIFGTAHLEKHYNSIEKGSYKVLWGACYYAETAKGKLFEECYSEYDSCENELAAIQDKWETAYEEDRAQYEEAYENLENYTKTIELKLKRTMLDKKNAASLCIASAVALFVAQFIYTFIMHDDKKKKLIIVEGEEIIEDNAEALEASECVADAPVSEEILSEPDEETEKVDVDQPLEEDKPSEE